VHSSADLPKTLGMSPREVIAGLKAIVGESGTLAMPAIPLLKGEPAGAQRLQDESYESVLTYDVRRSPPWTGTLPRQLMQTAGSMRSHHPLNTMVALGPHATAMMGHNLSEPEPMPCGPGSAWAYCHQHGAKILAINCDLAHSLTMIHVVEDMHDGGWPIRHWYRQRRFKVVADGAERMVTVRERRAHWSMFFAERSLSRQLAVQGISRTHQTPGLTLTFCDSRELIAFARQHPDPVFPYWIPFHRLFSSARTSGPSR
jgi:aminoglycoside 3-N-acetyltransferase